jgi:hypothetical protein
MTDFFVSLHQNINIPGLEFMSSLTENPVLATIIFYMADLPIFIIPAFLVTFWIYSHIK